MFEAKTRIRICAAFIAALFIFAAVAAVSPIILSPFAESASSGYAVMELTTGAMLAQNNAEKKLPMASTTKIMTALLVCEDCNLDETVTVPDEAVGTEGSSIYLKKGEQIDVRDLLYGLMLRSGNDSAVALAVIHSGSVGQFVNRMNERAAEIGARDTHFCNPNGLHDEAHYTTARDLCAIACAAMKNPTFRKVAGTKSWNGRFRSYSNKNKMLYNYEGATGIKTGYTTKAGRCLVSSAMRDGMEVVCVVLNEYDMYNRSAQLLDDAFIKYELYTIPADKTFMCGNKACRAEGEQSFVAERGGEMTYATAEANGGTYGSDCAGQLKIFREKSLIFTTNLYSID